MPQKIKFNIGVWDIGEKRSVVFGNKARFRLGLGLCPFCIHFERGFVPRLDIIRMKMSM